MGFFIHYLDALRLPKQSELHLSSPTEPLAEISTNETLQQTDCVHGHPTLVLGGYSYGSLITMHLPSIEVIIARFAHVNQGTAEAEIRLRAASLAKQWNQVAETHIQMHQGQSLEIPNKQKSPSISTSMSIGGEECEPGSRRPSRESRSIDVVRKHLHRAHSGFGRRSCDEIPTKDSLEQYRAPVSVTPRICYLLISPLLPPISSLAALSFNSIKARFVADLRPSPTVSDVSQRLGNHPTLAIYGDSDPFVLVKKLRAWSVSFRQRQCSLFCSHEIINAGHFWRESRSKEEMRMLVRGWLVRLLAS